MAVFHKKEIFVDNRNVIKFLFFSNFFVSFFFILKKYFEDVRFVLELKNSIIKEDTHFDWRSQTHTYFYYFLLKFIFIFHEFFNVFILLFFCDFKSNLLDFKN